MRGPHAAKLQDPIAYCCGRAAHGLGGAAGLHALASARPQARCAFVLHAIRSLAIGRAVLGLLSTFYFIDLDVRSNDAIAGSSAGCRRLYGRRTRY